ncbi:MAG: hypothetical protein ACXWXQ_04475 [Actinomycetota bacterium]
MSDRTSPHGRPIVGSITECRSYRPGRVCRADGCTTVLSIYNPESRCAVHERHGADPKALPTRPASTDWRHPVLLASSGGARS